MSRAAIARRLAEAEGHDPIAESEPLKPRLPDWLLEKILESCRGQPDDLLRAWLGTRQVSAHDIGRWCSESQAAQHWSDPRAVMAAASSLEGHPMRKHLGGMLGALIQRHAPQNVGYLHPDFVTSAQ